MNKSALRSLEEGSVLKLEDMSQVRDVNGHTSYKSNNRPREPSVIL